MSESMAAFDKDMDTRPSKSLPFSVLRLAFLAWMSRICDSISGHKKTFQLKSNSHAIDANKSNLMIQTLVSSRRLWHCVHSCCLDFAIKSTVNYKYNEMTINLHTFAKTWRLEDMKTCLQSSQQNVKWMQNQNGVKRGLTCADICCQSYTSRRLSYYHTIAIQYHTIIILLNPQHR